MYLKIFTTHNRHIAVGNHSSYIDNEEIKQLPYWYYDEDKNVIFQMSDYIRFDHELRSKSKWHRIVATGSPFKIKGIPTFSIPENLLRKVSDFRNNYNPKILGLETENIRTQKSFGRIAASGGKLLVNEILYSPW